MGPKSVTNYPHAHEAKACPNIHDTLTRLIHDFHVAYGCVVQCVFLPFKFPLNSVEPNAGFSIIMTTNTDDLYILVQLASNIKALFR